MLPGPAFTRQSLRLVRILLLSDGAMLLALAAGAAASLRDPVLLAELRRSGVASLTVMNTTNSLMQLSTEAAMRGRVMALRVSVALGGTPVGAPIVGWVADHCGPRWALGVGAASGFVAAIVAACAFARQEPSRSHPALRP